MEAKAQVYPAEISQVVSGDDLIVMVDLGVEDLWKRQRVRLHQVDTPNAIGEGMDTEAGKVRAQVRTLVRGRRLQLNVVQRGANSWVCVVKIESPEGLINLNELMIEQGYEFKRRG